MANLKESKSLLAKLLAQENLSVQHQNIPTAYFDVKNRVLGLPIWNDMSGDLYDLLCGHEVGHALYTPPAGWHDQVADKDFGDHFKGFLNVLEDARIEKFIKRRYPGIGKSFYTAYQELWAKDFFGVEGLDLNDLLFIDRVNILTKVGSYVSVKMDFTEKEQGYIKRIQNLETWDEVVELAHELYAEAKEELKEKQIRARMTLIGELGEQTEDETGQGQQMDIEIFGDHDKEAIGEPKSITDEAFRQREGELLDLNAMPYTYATFPKVNSRDFTLPIKQVMSMMNFSQAAEKFRAQALRDFNTKNTKFINYMVKEFEMRRNAAQLGRAKIAKSGEIDVKKVHMYKLTDDLFRKFTIVPNGKNHGLIVIFDMSASMYTDMDGTVEQLLILTQFCRKVNIKFDIYGFSNQNFEGDKYKWEADWYRDQYKRFKPVEGDLYMRDAGFKLIHFFSDAMTTMQYKQQMSNMTLAMRCYPGDYRTPARHANSPYKDLSRYDLPEVLRLNSTPLLEALIITPDLFRRFKERTKADIVNIAFLTDGAPDGSLEYMKSMGAGRGLTDYNFPFHGNVVLTDPVTKVSVKTDKLSHKGQKLLLEAIRATTGANVVGFFLGSNVRSAVRERSFDYSHERVDDTVVDKIMKNYRRDRVAIVEDLAGYNELYVVKGSDMDFEDDDITGATSREIAKSFSKMQKNKAMNRVLLNRFVQMIA